jgi:mono/diheme cytochrome c family protein
MAATTPGRPPSELDERRAEFQRYKEDVKKRGKPFYPYAMFHDTVMSLVVVTVIVALAAIWKWTAWATVNGHHTGVHDGLLGPEFTERADPGTTNFVPRPDWYFYFLFYLLRIFKWPESVFLGTVGVPTILLILAIGFPFLDRRRERRPLRRPVAMVAMALTAVSMGVLTYKGATAKESLASEVIGSVPSWIKSEQLPPAAVPGAKLFAASGCTSCHTYLGTGSSNLGAPDLTDIGSKHLGIDFQIRHLKCPSCVTPGSPMPKFASLGEANLRKLAIFLEASKGKK